MPRLLIALMLQTYPTPETVPLPEGHARFGTEIRRTDMIPGWEIHPAEAPTGCEEVAEPLTRPVTRETRSEAIERLRDVVVHELSESEAARLIGETRPTDRPLALSLLENYLADLRTRIHPNNNVAEQVARFDADLHTGRYSGLRPFLVRATARLQDEYPGLPGYFSGVCENRSLYVISLIFSYTIPPTRRAPAVVFLREAPATVHAVAQFAW